MKFLWLGVLCALAAGIVYALWPAPPEPVGGGLRLLRGGAEAELSGPLSTPLAAQLQAALATPSPPRTIQLDSTGGSVDGAERIMALIRRAGVDTAVTDRCFGVCAAVFMAGRQRWIGGFAQLGLSAGLGRLYADAGIPPAFQREAASAPPGQVWLPETPDLLRTGVATGVAEPDRFALAGFGPAPTPDSIRARLLTVPLYKTVAAADPDGFAADLALWDDAVLSGQPGTAAFAATRQRLATTFQRALPHAPAALQEQQAALFADERAWMIQHRPSECPAWAAALGGLPGPTDEELVARRRALMAAVIDWAQSAHDFVAAPPPAPAACAR